MINYWNFSRPKIKLDSIPEVLSVFSEVSLNDVWERQMGTQRAFEDALEQAGLKREGSRRDARGSGGRTYAAWLKSLGLIFKQEKTKQMKLTLAGEAIMAGESPVKILTNQILKYQFPSSYSLGSNVKINERFKIRPFYFLLKLLADDDIGYVTNEELSKIIIVKAENESDKCYENVKSEIIKYRLYGDQVLEEDFYEKYKSSRDPKNGTRKELIKKFEPLSNTIVSWLEYTQLAIKDDETKKISIIPERKNDVLDILKSKPSFIDRPHEHEYFQRRYGLDLVHTKDLRNLDNTQTVTVDMIKEIVIKKAYITLSLKKPIASITSDLILEISNITGIDKSFTEKCLKRNYPHGSIGSYMSSYFEMAFHGRDDAVEFEKATSLLFNEVFKYKSKHYGQTGSLSTPDVLIISDENEYQAIIDNKAYGCYSITGDHHNRMVHNYIEKINSYSISNYPVGFFAYISGGFSNNINRQLKAISSESGIEGGAITVSNFIKMIENQTSGAKIYTHEEIKKMFSQNREVLLTDI